MEYLLFAFLAGLFIWVVRLALVGRRQRAQPSQLVHLTQTVAPTANRFISPRAIRNLEMRRNQTIADDLQSPDPSAPKPVHRTRADMQTEVRDRGTIKTACIALLDTIAIEHPAGHTSAVARYVLRSKDGDRIEILFEKSGKGRAKLWLSQRHAGAFQNTDIEWQCYPASDLYKSTEEGGHRSYGRHSALKQMRDLAHADLVRFTIDRVEQMEVLVAGLVDGAR